MLERSDRMIRDNRLLISVVIIFCVVAGAGLAAWMRMNAPEGPSVQPPVRPALSVPATRNEPLMVTVFIPAGDMLMTGVVGVTRQPDTQSQSREVLVALFADQRAAAAPILRDVRFKAVYLDAAGTAYVDLSAPLQKSVKASAWEEFIAVYALVNTLMQNFEEIRQVRLMVDGKEAQTFAGHLDLSRSFTKRMDLVKQ
jgi:hypothetical protein